MKEKNEGITIIALVVTIIIMLILATVTIRIAFKGGLIDYAKKATGEMQNSIDKEKETMDGRIEEDGVWYNSIEDYIAGIPSGSQGEEEIPELSHNWIRGTGDDIDKFTCSNCKKTYIMGQKINYIPTGSTTSTTIVAAKTGSDGDQTIERQTATWIVLGIKDTDEDGVKETLLITTESPVEISTEKTLYLKGAAPYEYMASYYDTSGKKVEGEIDRVCRLLYSNSDYGEARGMTIEDVNEALNFTDVGTKIGGMYHDGLKWNSVGNLTTKLKELPEAYWSAIKGNFKTPDGTNTVEAFGEYELNGYEYYLNNDKTALKINGNTITSMLTELERVTIFGATENYDYWLASRGVVGYFISAEFGPAHVYYGRAGSYSGAFDSADVEGDGDALLRPVVSLLYDIPAVK